MKSIIRIAFVSLLMLSSHGWAANNNNISDRWQLLLFTIPGCSSCIMMRQEVIEPMIETGVIQANQFEEVLQMTESDWQYVHGVGYRQIRDLKNRYQTSLFPTLVILDQQGNKVADNIVGMTSVEHYRTKLLTVLKDLDAKADAKTTKVLAK